MPLLLGKHEKNSKKAKYEIKTGIPGDKQTQKLFSAH